MRGNFNLSTFKWIVDTIFLNYFSPNDMLLFNAFSSAGLTQIIGEGTFFSNGNMLDLCLVLDQNRVRYTLYSLAVPNDLSS